MVMQCFFFMLPQLTLMSPDKKKGSNNEYFLKISASTHQKPLLPGLIKRLISSRERSSTLSYLLSDANYSLNIDITLQIRQFSVNHFLNSGHNFFSLFISNLMAWRSSPVRFSKSLFDFNSLHSPFVYQHAATIPDIRWHFITNSLY